MRKMFKMGTLIMIAIGVAIGVMFKDKITGLVSKVTGKTPQA